MGKKLMLTAVLCLSAAWLMAQAPTSPAAPAGSSGQNASQAAPGSSSGQNATQSAPGDQQASPGAQPGAAAQAAPDAGSKSGSDMSITEGCLGGSNPNYTLTDKNGTTYQLIPPPAADVSVLAKHVGESVAVMGTVNKAGASADASGSAAASGASGSAASSGQPSIQMTRIGRGSGNCPAAPGATPKSPTEKK